MGPRADFACLSKACRTAEGEATVYELPVAAKVCPVCGSKRLQRLFNAVNVARGVGRGVDRLVGESINDQQAQQDQARAAEAQNGPALAVPVSQIGAALGKINPAFASASVGPAGGARVAEHAPAPLFGALRGRPTRPTVVARDRGSETALQDALRRPA